MPEPLAHDPARDRAASLAREPLWTLENVADYLGVSRRTVRRLVAAGRIPCARIASRLRFEPADVLRFVAARKE